MRQTFINSSWKLIFFFFCINTLTVEKTLAQTEFIDNQIWIDVIPHFEINNRLEYFGDLSYRTTTSESKFRRLMARPSIRYHWTYEIDLIAGIGLFGTWEPEYYNTFELRPYQGVRLNWPRIWHMNFKHRALVEERMHWNNQGDFDPSVRFRYRIKTKLPINKPNIGYKTIYLPISFEIFGNAGKDEIELFQNRNRAMIGAGYVFSDKWIAEFEVTFQRSRATATDELSLTDRIFRFKLSYDGWIFGE